MHEIKRGVPCYAVQITSNGGILVGTRDGLLVLDGDTKEETRKVASGFKVIAISLFDKGFLVVLNKNYSNSQVVHLDEHCVEVKRWSVGKYASDMTIANRKVYVSLVGEPDIMVYDIETGAELPMMIHNGRSSGLIAYPPASLIITDEEYNSLEKHKLQNGKSAIIWSRKIIRPWIQCVDDHGLIWVRSHRNDCITVLSRKGNICCFGQVVAPSRQAVSKQSEK